MAAHIIPLRSVSATPETLEERASFLSDQYKYADAQEILRVTLSQEFPERITAVSSFGAESAVLLHLISTINPEAPVIFLDTEKHFAQTLSYKKKIATTLGLTNIITIAPDAADKKVTDPRGDLWRSNTEACCDLRKVRPLASALAGYDGWITGRKQFHGGARLKLPFFEASATHLKINPLARWTPEDIQAYFERHDLPRHPLVAQGFPSIGCWPCTHPIAEGEDVRSGRWRGQAKTECGIHTR